MFHDMFDTWTSTSEKNVISVTEPPSERRSRGFFFAKKGSGCNSKERGEGKCGDFLKEFLRVERSEENI